MTDPVPSKDLTTQDGLRILGGFAMWSSPNEPQAELRAAARAVLHDRLALIRQLEEMRVAAAKAAFEREPPHCSTCACGLAPDITSRTVELTDDQRHMLTARGVEEIPSASEPAVEPSLSFGQAVTDGQIVAIYAGEEGAQFKLLRHNIWGVLSEVRRPWDMRRTFRPATYDEMRSACPHDWLDTKYCSTCGTSQPPRDDPMRRTMFGGAPAAVVDAIADGVGRKVDAEILGAEPPGESHG